MIHPYSWGCIIALIVCYLSSGANAGYEVGAGIYDITGPAARVAMEGYAMFNQTSSGIHFRLRARAFVILDQTSGNRVAYVNLDVCMSSIVVKKRVIEALQQTIPNTYDYDNVLIASIHTHSGPGGYSWYTIYDIMTLGYQEANVKVIATGIVMAITRAHAALKPAKLLLGSDSLISPLTNINRSPYSYMNNPASERSKYSYDVDKEMTVLRFQGLDGTEIGLINWFAVHGTSMQNTNKLISGDNKGYAMYLFEMFKNGNKSLPGKGPFVAAFSNSNEGDVTPNVKGAFCPDGSLCDYQHSTCNGISETCHGLGPGVDDFDSTRIIGRQQFTEAVTIYNKANVVISGPVDYRYQWVDMENVQVLPQYTGLQDVVSTCNAALGDSFAAGTTDGPGDFDFRQGSNSTKDNPFWNILGHLISPPPPDQEQCHAPKPILLYTGGIKEPAPWTASVLPIQMVRVGQLFIIAVPGEFTTMSGRRLRDAVLSIVKPTVSNAIVVITGLSNAYSQYVTTPEEYAIQRYEGASTLFGPNTLPAYIQLYSSLATAIVKDQPVDPGDEPEDWSDRMIDILPGPVDDLGRPGAVLQQPISSYKAGALVTVVFVAGDPRNNFKTEDSYLFVERASSNGTWSVVAVDGHWETKFIWSKKSTFTESTATIEWDTTGAVLGTYRIRHTGTRRIFPDFLFDYEGISNPFTITI